MSAPGRRIAQQVIEAVPLVMRVIRDQMRRHRGLEVSVPQFRVLAFLRRTEGASLSEIADHIGLTPPTTCRMIDALVGRGLVERRGHPGDRRRLSLCLTSAGRKVHDTAMKAAQSYLARRLARLRPSERATISRAMALLREALADDNGFPASHGR